MGVSHTPARHSSHHRSGPRRVAAAGLVALAALTFVAPLPQGLLAVWRQAYAGAQPVLTSLTAWLPLPALDTLIVVAAGWLAWRAVRWWRGGRSMRPSPATIARGLARTVTLAAVAWLVFLAAWGWHYQVPTLETRLAIQPDELSAARGEEFARAVVSTLNDTYADAHARAWPSRREMPSVVGPRVAGVLPEVGESWRPAWPQPRRSLVDLYFRTAGIDGMTNPFGLEVVLNSRVLPMELPALAAHEYAHLAGFAD
ncbi:MAG TPA: DUF3810 family protein, partial [Luteitalea sp.]|nr:DUF3810 family protein [Luteitalea sp.]